MVYFELFSETIIIKKKVFSVLHTDYPYVILYEGPKKVLMVQLSFCFGFFPKIFIKPSGSFLCFYNSPEKPKRLMEFSRYDSLLYMALLE